MAARFGLLLVLLLGLLLACFTLLKLAGVAVPSLANSFRRLPLILLVVGAFLAGASAVVIAALLRDLARAVREARRAHKAGRAQEMAALYHRGVDAQLAGRREAAAEAYGDVLAREPGHPEAHLRLGDLARERGDHEAALAHHLQALGSAERADTLLTVAGDYERLGRVDDALSLYRRLLQEKKDHLPALRAIRALSVARERWREALEVQERLVALARDDERSRELGWLAGIHYEIGKSCLAEGSLADARRHFGAAIQADRAFLPAHLALGDAWERAGDRREAIRTWRRAAELASAPVLLQRLERAYRDEGRPTRMISLYQEGLERAPGDLALAFALGRVYFELAMLDEALDQFQKLEVRAPDLAPLHAFLGAIYERRGQAAEAFEEYRRVLHLVQSFEWPHHCAACGAAHTRWQDRCPVCGRWDTSRA
jgi:lipopolysaccharide biosynthesis regulator YciM